MGYPLQRSWASLMVQLVKNLPAMGETWVQDLGWDYCLEKGKATHSSILAWRIPQTVQSMGLQRVRHNLVTFTSLPVLSFSRVPSTSEARSYSSGSIPWPQPKQSGGVIPNLFFFFLNLPALGLSCNMWDLTCGMYSSSLTRDKIQAPCVGSTEY